MDALGKCAYCGLSKSRYINGSWTEKSFIRVDWPIVPLEEVLRRTDDERCSPCGKGYVFQWLRIREQERIL